MIVLILSILAAYLIGSTPFGFIIVKLVKGADIRGIGSGNIGATNVVRAAGKLWGGLTLVLDALKGLFVVTILSNLALKLNPPIDGVSLRLLLGISVVIGHNWTLFLGFKGGKGMATSLGVLLGLGIAIISLRFALILAVLVWLGIFLLTKYVSLSSLISAFLVPFLALLFKAPLQVVIFGAILCIFVFIRHKSNIARLIRGQESKIRLFGR